MQSWSQNGFTEYACPTILNKLQFQFLMSGVLISQLKKDHGRGIEEEKERRENIVMLEHNLTVFCTEYINTTFLFHSQTGTAEGFILVARFFNFRIPLLTLFNQNPNY